MTDVRAGGPDPTERALSELGRAIAYPATPDMAPHVRAIIEEHRSDVVVATPTPRTVPWRRPAWLWAAVAILAAVGLLLTLPRTREAVADLFGLRGVRFTEAPAARMPSASDGATAPASRLPPFPGDPVSLDEARGRLDFPILLPEALGTPDTVLASTPPAAGQVTLLYGPRPGLPTTATPAVALALTQFRGNTEPFITKSIPPEARLEAVLVGGARGFWLEGAHPVMFQDATGAVRTDAPRIAGNTLLWQRGGITFRLESSLGRDEAIRIAESLR